MKKAIALAMASVMAAGLLAGCGGSAANSTAASSEAASSEAASTSTEAATEAHTVNTTDPITLTISWWGGDARQAVAGFDLVCLGQHVLDRLEVVDAAEEFGFEYQNDQLLAAEDISPRPTFEMPEF